MSYCINPNCQTPHHYGNIFYNLCQSCNSQLILHQKYRVIQPLEHNNYFHNYLVYEQNLSGNKTKLLKVLKPDFNQTPIETVWIEEAEILMTLGKKNYPSIPQVDDYFCHQINDDLPLHCIIIDNHPKNHQLYIEKWLLYSQPLQEKTAILCLREIAYLCNDLPERKLSKKYLIALGLIFVILLTNKELSSLYREDVLIWHNHTVKISVIFLDLIDELINPDSPAVCPHSWLLEKTNKVTEKIGYQFWIKMAIWLIIILSTGSAICLIYLWRTHRIVIKGEIDRKNDVVVFPYQKGTDSQGKTAEFNLVILSASYRWKIANADSVQVPNQNKFITLSDLKSKLEKDGIRRVMQNPNRIISVGTASCEGELVKEENRALQRAVNIQENLVKKLLPAKDFNLLNLGQNKTADCVPNPEITSFQRSIIIIGVKKETPGIILNEALRDRLLGQIEGLNLDEYSRGTSDKFKVE